MPAALSRSGIDAPCLQLCHVPAKHQRLIFRAKERESTQVRGLTVCWSRGVGRNGGSRHSPFGLHGDLGSRIVLSPTCLHTLIYAPLAACPPPHPQLRLFRAPHLAYLSESLLAPASVSVPRCRFLCACGRGDGVYVDVCIGVCRRVSVWVGVRAYVCLNVRACDVCVCARACCMLCSLMDLIQCRCSV